MEGPDGMYHGKYLSNLDSGLTSRTVGRNIVLFFVVVVVVVVQVGAEKLNVSNYTVTQIHIHV